MENGTLQRYQYVVMPDKEGYLKGEGPRKIAENAYSKLSK